MALGYGRTGTNNFSTAKFIVDLNGLQTGATHSTITSALASASPGDTIFVKPGTYTENFTWGAGINIAAYSCDAQNPNVTIVGKITCTDAGDRAMSGIRLETNSDNCLVASGTSIIGITFTNCHIAATNNTAISHTTTAASSTITFYQCTGTIETTGIALFSKTSAGTLSFQYCNLNNPGNSTTASTSSDGGLVLRYTYANFPISRSGTSTCIVENSIIYTQNLSTTSYTSADEGFDFLYQSQLSGGAASAVSIGAGATCDIYHCDILSSNSSPITGAGTVRYSSLVFPDTQDAISVTTQTAKVHRPGITRSTHQPAFSFIAGSNFTSVSGDGTPYIIPFGTTIFDQDGGYSSPNWIATYGGKYQLSAKILLYNLGAGHTAAEFRIVTSNRNYTVWTNPYNMRAVVGNNFSTMDHSHLADIDAADLVSTLLVVYNSTKTVNVENSSSLSGVMVC